MKMSVIDNKSWSEEPAGGSDAPAGPTILEHGGQPMKGALSGIRVLDFSWGVAGPFATTLMGYLGAEVIKVESWTRLDFSRRHTLALTPEKHGPFQDANVGKAGITLNLTLEAARSLAYELVAISDIVVENLRPGVSERLGVSYERLRQIKPDIIVLSSSALGRNGPQQNYTGFAPQFGALSGLGHLTGYEDGPPAEFTVEMDSSCASVNFFAILAALDHRNRTGEGQWIETSAWEAIVSMTGHTLLEYTMNGRVPMRRGNLDPYMCPHGNYPCEGTDRWISIAVATDEEWKALCDAMGNPDWTNNPNFSIAGNRWEHREEVDRLIGEWTVRYNSIELMDLLQRLGVAAIASFTSEDIFSIPHLSERQFFQSVVHPAMGVRVVSGYPWRLSRTPGYIRSPAPLVGQHNAEVFGELLGLDAKSIKLLEEQGIMR